MDKVDAITIDAASNETCSANAAKDDLHKNLLAVILDRTHASRRGASRPTEADPYFKDLFNNQVRRPSSIVQRIHRSPLMKEWYVTELRKGNTHDHFRNSSSLGAAKHRHDSWSDPAVQWVMTTAAMQGAAQRATVHFQPVTQFMWIAKPFLMA